MPAIKLTELEYMNVGLHRGGTGSGDHGSGVSVMNCTSTNGTYADALEWVLSVIPKIRNSKQIINEY